jgi:hypothetical protein
VGHHEAVGTPQKRVDVSKLAEACWTSRIGLQEGLERTVCIGSTSAICAAMVMATA